MKMQEIGSFELRKATRTARFGLFQVLFQGPDGLQGLLEHDVRLLGHVDGDELRDDAWKVASRSRFGALMQSVATFEAICHHMRSLYVIYDIFL